MKEILILVVLLLSSITQAAQTPAAQTPAAQTPAAQTPAATDAKTVAATSTAEKPKQVDDSSYQKAGKPDGEKADEPPKVAPKKEAATTVKKVAEDAQDTGEWSYPADNLKWGGTCNSGKAQSPIDLPKADSTQDQYPLTDYMQYRKVTIRGQDNKKGLKWKAIKGEPAFGDFTLENVKYKLRSWAIHSGSEHTILGKQYDMEIQFKHESDGGQFLFISALCSVMPLTEPNSFFKQLQTAMISPKDVNVNKFFSEMDTKRYYQYSGSLTTPPCTQDVDWIVLASVCSVPQEFYVYASNLDSMKGNYRPPQDRNDRPITLKAGHLTDSWSYPARNADWGGDCLTGKEQSPIDLPLTVLASITDKPDLMDKMQYTAVDFSGTDTGKGLKWMSEKDMGYLDYDNKKYGLVQFNIHSKSEHTIAGEQYELEIQMLHKAEDDPTKRVIVAVLCRGENFGASTFFTQLMTSMKTPTNIDLKGTLLNNLDTTKYFGYPGSLTTPPCTEGVEWMVIAGECKVPKDFLIWVKQYASMKNNFRPPQKMGIRSVETVELADSMENAGNAEFVDDITDLQIPAILKFGVGFGTVAILVALILRCNRRDPMKDALLHDIDEI